MRSEYFRLLGHHGLQRTTTIRAITRSCYGTQPHPTIRERDSHRARPGPIKSTFMTPREIREWLDRFVVGQEQAKKVLATAVYYHYVRIRANRQEFDMYPRGLPDYEKSNIMMIGPTGTGKTFLFRQLLKILKVPYSISDATSFTQSGYVGEDVQMCIQRLFENSNYDPVTTSEGIVFIDEIDKIKKTTGGADGSRDVGGEGVQQALLKLVEGHEITVKNNSNNATFTGVKPDTQTIDTRNILFIVSGAFVGLDDIVKKRRDKETGKGIGFSVLPIKKLPAPSDFFTPNLKNSLTVEAADLQTFGFIPEFVARFPSRVTLSPLTVEDLYRVLVDVQGSLISQAISEFGFISVELSFTPQALKEICLKAAQAGTGARGLMDVLQGVLLETKYEVPGSNIGYVLMTQHGKALYWDKGQGKHFYSARASIEEDETNGLI